MRDVARERNVWGFQHGHEAHEASVCTKVGHEVAGIVFDMQLERSPLLPPKPVDAFCCSNLDNLGEVDMTDRWTVVRCMRYDGADAPNILDI